MDWIDLLPDVNALIKDVDALVPQGTPLDKTLTIISAVIDMIDGNAVTAAPAKSTAQHITTLHLKRGNLKNTVAKAA